MFETERFIAEIKKRRCIWKLTDTSYHDRDARFLAWDEVAKAMFPAWHSYTSDEKTLKGRILNKKWKNIKDYYIKELKAQKNIKAGVITKKRKKYVYFDLLEFLTSSMDPRKNISSSIAVKNSADKLKAEEKAKSRPIRAAQTARNVQPNVEPKNDSDVAYPKEPPSWPTTSNADGAGALENKLSLLADRLRQTVGEEMDADKAFFMSILPTVQKLNDEQKIDLRIEILNTLKRIQFPHSTLYAPSPTIQSTYTLQHQNICEVPQAGAIFDPTPSPTSCATFVHIKSPMSDHSDSP